MSNEEPGIGHNVADERLRQIVSRLENIDEEIKGLNSDKRDIMQEAVSAGFDKKALAAVLRLRKMEPDARQELEALIDVYSRALGE